MKPTSVTSSEVKPDGRGALFWKESNINQYIYLWFSAFVPCVTFSFVYRIIQSSGLWRQTVVTLDCRANTHCFDTKVSNRTLGELQTDRQTDRHTHTHTHTNTLRLYPPWWIELLHNWFKHFKVDWSIYESTRLTLKFTEFCPHNVYLFPLILIRNKGYFPSQHPVSGRSKSSTVIPLSQEVNSVIPRLTKIIRSGITFVSRNVISCRFLQKIL